MSEATIAAIITALIAGPLGVIVTNWLNRNKNAANINKLITDAAGNLVQEYRELNEWLQLEIKGLRETIGVLEHEVGAQANAIENLNAQVLKYRLALVITVTQLRMAGFEPMIDPANIDTMSVDELKMVAEGASNAEHRRQQRKQDQDQDQTGDS